MRWTFEPDEIPETPSVREAYLPRRRNPNPKNNWKAPEHSKMTSDMKRDYPRDELGRIIAGRDKELVMDPRPTIMKQEQQARFTQAVS